MVLTIKHKPANHKTNKLVIVRKKNTKMHKNTRLNLNKQCSTPDELLIGVGIYMYSCRTVIKISPLISEPIVTEQMLSRKTQSTHKSQLYINILQ